MEIRRVLKPAGQLLVIDVLGDERNWPRRLDFAAWIARMRTPEVHVAALRALQAGAPLEGRRALSYADDGSFTCTTGAFWARRRD